MRQWTIESCMKFKQTHASTQYRFTLKGIELSEYNHGQAPYNELFPFTRDAPPNLLQQRVIILGPGYG